MNQNKVKGKRVLHQQELLYAKDRSFIEDVAQDSMHKEIQKSTPIIDAILDCFADKVYRDRILFEHVVTGKTNVYEKYANYFRFNRSQGFRTIKYRDGSWARSSYPLVRNVVEAQSRENTRYARISDQLHRHVLDERIIRVTGDDYDENQLTMFDQFPDTIEDSTNTVLEIITTFENLPTNIFVFRDGEYRFNEKVFSSYQAGDLEKLRSLPSKMVLLLQMFLLQRSYLENEPQEFGESYIRPIQMGLKDMVSLLQDDSEVLEKTYSWCQVFNECREKEFGDVNAGGFQKRKGDSRTS